MRREEKAELKQETVHGRIDRRLTIITSGIHWKPEYEDELKSIDAELIGLRELVDAEHTKTRSEATPDRVKKEREVGQPIKGLGEGI